MIHIVYIVSKRINLGDLRFCYVCEYTSLVNMLQIRVKAHYIICTLLLIVVSLMTKFVVGY